MGTKTHICMLMVAFAAGYIYHNIPFDADIENWKEITSMILHWRLTMAVVGIKPLGCMG